MLLTFGILVLSNNKIIFRVLSSLLCTSFMKLHKGIMWSYPEYTPGFVPLSIQVVVVRFGRVGELPCVQLHLLFFLYQEQT